MNPRGSQKVPEGRIRVWGNGCKQCGLDCFGISPLSSTEGQVMHWVAEARDYRSLGE